MKKLLLIAMMAVASITASAQQTLNISTYTGTDMAKYDGMTKNVSVSRYVFRGWNTISLPFAMSKDEVEEAFGSDCRLETLVGVENDGVQLKLNFQDVKAKGIEANKPYILYFNNDNQAVKITAENKLIKNSNSSLSFADNNGVVVTFAGTKAKTDSHGLYGILARDNEESTFVNVDIASNGFFATRCYISLSNGNNTILKANHISSDVTSVNAVVRGEERVDVYNVSGVKIATSASISEINAMNKGIYVVKGKKIAVK